MIALHERVVQEPAATSCDLAASAKDLLDLRLPKMLNSLQIRRSSRNMETVSSGDTVLWNSGSWC